MTLLPPPRNGTSAYLITIFGMTLLGVSAVIAVFLMRPDKDNTAIIVSILGFIGPTLAAILAYFKAQETHLVVNSRMDEFKRGLQEAARLAVAAARAEGVIVGKEAGVAAADARTDQLTAGIATQKPVPAVLDAIESNTAQIAKNTQ